MIHIKHENEDSHYDNIVETHEITTFKNLLDMININDNTDLRKNFIFRGLKNVEYDLIPSALRTDIKNDINDYISDSEFNFNLIKQITTTDMNGKEKAGLFNASIDKNEQPLLKKSKITVNSEGELQFKREVHVLLNFLNYADKIGLKIPSNTTIRQWMHNSLEYSDNEEIWPKPEFYEIISLAQHHNLPTRALDWSYDYKVALFFAVEDILDNHDNDCVLWAFNYKVFEEKNITGKNINKKEGLIIYRPEYNTNPNLNAQKGIFTFWASNDYLNMNDATPFDKLIAKKIIKMPQDTSGKVRFHLNGTIYEIGSEEKIFHKFIISGKLKAKILKELYLEGYGHERIYPNYYGVVNSMKNRVKLEKIINENTGHMPFSI